jgi:hypothetical protein
VVAIFAHLPVPLSRRLPRAGCAVLAAGAGVSAVLIALLPGLVTPLSIPTVLVGAFPGRLAR